MTIHYDVAKILRIVVIGVVVVVALLTGAADSVIVHILAKL